MNKFFYSLLVVVGILVLVACERDKGSLQEITSIDDGNNMTQTEDEELIPLFIPALSVVLFAAEEKKGVALTEEEVLSIRDNSITMMMPKSAAKSLSEKCAYEDLDPENVWNEWLLFRDQQGLEVDVDGGALVVDNPSGNLDMKTAEKKARESLDQFKQLIKNSADVNPLIKVHLQETNTSARMWMIVDTVNKDSFDAHLFEVPSDFEELQAGDKFDITNNEILDWMFNDSGDVYGAFTIRVQRQSMTENERKEMDEYMGVIRYK